MLLKDLSPYLLETVIQTVRQFFYEKQFHEVRVPILNEALPLELNLFAFSANWHFGSKKKQYYLPTSPEAALKKALARGEKQVFSISSSFRDQDPSDENHHPEFIMLEWYRTDADYNHIIQDLEELIVIIEAKLSTLPIFQSISKHNTLLHLPLPPWKRLSLPSLFDKVTGVPLKMVLSLSSMKQLAHQLGYQTTQASWEELFNQIVADKIEPLLGDEPVFIEELPSQLSPLCSVKQSEPHLAERFEFYLGGEELANGNNEQTDPSLVKKAFDQEQARRDKQNLPSHPIDKDLLAALTLLHQSPQHFAGVGLGLERLIKVLIES